MRADCCLSPVCLHALIIEDLNMPCGAGGPPPRAPIRARPGPLDSWCLGRFAAVNGVSREESGPGTKTGATFSQDSDRYIERFLNRPIDISTRFSVRGECHVPKVPLPDQ